MSACSRAVLAKRALYLGRLLDLVSGRRRAWQRVGEIRARNAQEGPSSFTPAQEASQSSHPYAENML